MRQSLARPWTVAHNVDGIVGQSQGIFAIGMIHDDGIVRIRVLRGRSVRVCRSTGWLATLTGDLAGALTVKAAWLRPAFSGTPTAGPSVDGPQFLQLLQNSSF